MFFLSSEKHSRHSVAEQAIDTFQDGLNSPALRRKLGPSLGRFAALADCLYVPNVRHGLVSPPRRHRGSEGIAVIALGSSDKVRVSEHYSKQSNKQQTAMKRQLADAGLSEREALTAVHQIDSLVADIQGAVPTRINSGIQYHNNSVQAENWTTEHPLPIDRSAFPHANPKAIKWSRLGLPTILIRYNGPDGQTSPSAMLHELVHVDQIESEPLQPVFDPRDRHSRNAYMLSSELPAYPAYMVGAMSVEARVLSGVDQSDLQRVDHMQLAIEGVRQSICSPKDPFDSSAQYTDVIMSSLQNIDIG